MAAEEAVIHAAGCLPKRTRPAWLRRASAVVVCGQEFVRAQGSRWLPGA